MSESPNETEQSRRFFARMTNHPARSVLEGDKMINLDDIGVVIKSKVKINGDKTKDPKLQQNIKTGQKKANKFSENGFLNSSYFTALPIQNCWASEGTYRESIVSKAKTTLDNIKQ